MSPRKTLVLSSVAFAVLWTAGMLWWSAPLVLGQTIMLVICGALAGLLWYWLMGLWTRRAARG